jgi:integrase
MGIYKRCSHRARERDRCADPWYGSYKLPGHPRAKVSLAKWTGEEITTKGQAQAAFDDLKAAVRAGTFDRRGRGVTAVQVAGMTFSKLVDEYYDKYARFTLTKPQGFASRVKPAVDAFGPLPITQIRTQMIQDWQLRLGQPRLIHGVERPPATATVNRVLSEVRRIMNWATGRGLLPASPFIRGGLAAIKLDHEDNQRDRRISDSEEDTLLSHASPLVRALIILALDTGVRRGEMLEITVRDVILDRSEIVLRGTTTKSGKTRTVPISTVRLRAVVEWFLSDAAGSHKPTHAPLISNEAGEPIGTFRRAWEDTNLRAHGYAPQRVRKTGALLPSSQQALGQIDLHWHDLRHEFASRLAERGVPITEIQRLLGHASVQTTERYISTTLARLKQSAVVLDRGKDFDPRPLGSPPVVKPAMTGVH